MNIAFGVLLAFAVGFLIWVAREAWKASVEYRKLDRECAAAFRDYMAASKEAERALETLIERRQRHAHGELQ